MSNLIRRKLTPYTAAGDTGLALPLDRTEPPVPYRALVPKRDLKTWSRYPSPKSLEEKIAQRFEVSPKNVIVTAGADEALDRAFRATLMPGEEVLTTSPTFEMIAKYAALAGATLVEVPWLGDEFPTAAFTERISSQARLIILVSPNNPTGQCISFEVIEYLALRYSDIPIVLDFAYMEFANNDPTRQLLQFPNVVVVRSFSKAWGLPGLRIGYALGSTEVIQSMRAAGGPYSVSAQSIETISANLERFEREMLDYVKRVRAERNELEEWLAANSVRFLPSQANFVLLFPDKAAMFDETMRVRSIATRSFESLPNARRMTMPGNAEAFDILKRPLKEIFELQSVKV